MCMLICLVPMASGNQGSTPLQIATGGGYGNVVQVLLEGQSDVNKHDKTGSTWDLVTRFSCTWTSKVPTKKLPIFPVGYLV